MNSEQQGDEAQLSGSNDRGEGGIPANEGGGPLQWSDFDEYGAPAGEEESKSAKAKAGCMHFMVGLPVGFSGWAILSGYLGLFAILVIPALPAFISGVIAIFHLRRNPELKGYARAIFGIVAGGGMMLLFLLALLGPTLFGN